MHIIENDKPREFMGVEPMSENETFLQILDVFAADRL
jgi:hypothetical protein